ncbi:hypothetical protein R1sor_006308 [Riccia sorocarpa]|uniref:NB-ARC domain-containing protein n=1 Tax=Riccia sorocarpa TaxID=122646 RepID=A0ABD3HM94_9MARC
MSFAYPGRSSAETVPWFLLVTVLAACASGARLHHDFDRVRRRYKWAVYGLGETQVSRETFNVQVVLEASSRFGDEFFMVNCDHFSICRPESKECDSYQHIVKLLNSVHTSEQERKTKGKIEGIVGAEPLVSSIVEHQLQHHVFLGLCGMGGVGKTTVAKLVFERLEDTFEYTCFFEDFKLISGNKDEMKERIWKQLRRYGKPISTEDTSLEVYVPLLRYEDAMALFLSYAFPGGKKPAGSLEDTVEKIVKRCDGLPLTLEVLGTYLSTVEDERIWEDFPDVLRAAESIDCLEERLWAKLQVSFDALHPDEREMWRVC